MLWQRLILQEISFPQTGSELLPGIMVNQYSVTISMYYDKIMLYNKKIGLGEQSEF